jgi:hypothetical protein
MAAMNKANQRFTLLDDGLRRANMMASLRQLFVASRIWDMFPTPNLVLRGSGGQENYCDKESCYAKQNHKPICGTFETTRVARYVGRF